MNISRQDAISSGQKRYFTGEACKHGHVAQRLASTRACCECAAIAVAKYNKENGPKIVAMVKDWRARNKDKSAAHWQNRMADPSQKVAKRISSAMRKCLGSAKAGRKWESIVGYGVAELRAHLERQFAPGMSWANSSDWHIDHIVAKSTFDHSVDSDIRACWALSNLRPLFAVENMRKHCKATHLL